MSYNERKNWLTGNILSDEWYTPKEVVEYIYNFFNTKNKKIICPYDTEKVILLNIFQQVFIILMIF